MKKTSLLIALFLGATALTQAAATMDATLTEWKKVTDDSLTEEHYNNTLNWYKQNPPIKVGTLEEIISANPDLLTLMRRALHYKEECVFEFIRINLRRYPRMDVDTQIIIKYLLVEEIKDDTKQYTLYQHEDK